VGVRVWKATHRVLVVEQPHADLPHIILARHPPRRFARRLNGRKQQRDQNADNGDHHQQFHQREPAVPEAARVLFVSFL